jgi:uncharacterized membrane protein YdjX (TVP38/TMEM64 family)
MSEPTVEYAAPSKRRGLRAFLHKIGPAGPVALIATVMPAIGLVALAAVAPILSPWLAAHKPGSVILYSVGVAVLIGFALAPTYGNALLGGWTFKFPVGFPALMAGLSGAAVIGYVVSHRMIGHRVSETIHEHPKWEVVRDALVGGSTLKTFAIVLLLRISPILPFSTTNVLLASCEVRFWPYLFGTILGSAPRQAALVYIASRASKWDAHSPEHRMLAMVSVAATVVVIIILAIVAKRALDRATRPA